MQVSKPFPVYLYAVTWGHSNMSPNPRPTPSPRHAAEEEEELEASLDE
jgi:hypothetical protein